MQEPSLGSPDNSASTDATLDVVGIGALNVDYIATAHVANEDWKQSIVAALSAMVPQLDPPLQWNTERSADHAVQAPSWAIPPDDVKAVLGGSAFNTIHALSRLRVGARVGYVGIAGSTPPAVSPFAEALDGAGIDRDFVRLDYYQPAGVCLSVMEHGEPTMLTYPGANLGMAAYLQRENDAIVDYLAGARVVHVTSLLDTQSPERLLRVLREVKKRSNPPLISFDPGFAWCVGSGDLLAEFGAVSDIVSMNQLELFAAADYTSVADDDHGAQVVLSRVMGGNGILIARSPGSVTCYTATAGAVTSIRESFTPLHEREVIDATGAGDAFAAGFLAGYLADSGRLDVAVRLGMRLARLHLQYVGSAGYQYFAEIAAAHIKRPIRAEVTSGDGAA